MGEEERDMLNRVGECEHDESQGAEGESKEKERKKGNKKGKKRTMSFDDGNKCGVCYLSRIPPRMDPASLRHMLSQYGEIERIYLAPTDPSTAQASRKRSGSSKGHAFSEGWVEFAKKSVAKRVASMLNGEQVDRLEDGARSNQAQLATLIAGISTVLSNSMQSLQASSVHQNKISRSPTCKTPSASTMVSSTEEVTVSTANAVDFTTNKPGREKYGAGVSFLSDWMNKEIEEKATLQGLQIHNKIGVFRKLFNDIPDNDKKRVKGQRELQSLLKASTSDDIDRGASSSRQQRRLYSSKRALCAMIRMRFPGYLLLGKL